MDLHLLRSHLLTSSPAWGDPHFTAGGAQVSAAARYAEQITVGTPGRCPEEPVLYLGLFDNSGSVTGGNDPIGQRFLEADLAIGRVGDRCRCGKDLVCTLHFDHPTSGDLDATPITRAHRADISASLAIPADGAGVSLLGPSLSGARAVADRHPDHRAVLVVCSDFQLFDNHLDAMIAFPGDVHAVVLRGIPPQLLLDAPDVTVTRVDHDSPPGTVARAVFTALTSTRPRARAIPPVGLVS